MTACNVEVIKLLGKYLDTSVGTVAFNTDKVLTTVIDKQSIEGFASIVLQLVAKSGVNLSQVEYLKIYQWLELLAMYGNQAAGNPTFAKCLLQDFNKALQKSTYLTGHSQTIADVAAYYVLYPSLERLSITEKESLINLRNSQTTPGELPKYILPHELANADLGRPVLFHPQPLAYPRYPVILYL